MTADVETWLATFEPHDPPSETEHREAAHLIAFVEGYADEIASFEEFRRCDQLALVILSVRTGRPQDSAVPLRHIERLGVCFSGPDSSPLVFMLRDDFPDTFHQQLPIEGIPRAICIDDREWEEARLGWTPAELLFRIQSWFERAANGTLHDPRQPVDPNFAASPYAFLISRTLIENPDHGDLIAIYLKNKGDTLIVQPMEDDGVRADSASPICVITYAVDPQAMQRMTFAPRTLGGLAKLLATYGIDLYDDLKTKFRNWLTDAARTNWRMNGKLAVIVQTPIIDPNDEQRDGEDIRAYLVAECVTGQIAQALGVAVCDETNITGDSVPFRRAIPAMPQDDEALSAFNVFLADVHLLMDRGLAATLSGESVADTRKAVLVGAGAAGSHLAEALGREGRFQWTVIDDDRLLPHNLARHTAKSADVLDHKANLVAKRLQDLTDDPAFSARAIAKKLRAGVDDQDDIDAALAEADLIIDASASPAAQRTLSDHSATGRRFSAFFNPAGTEAVLLAEPQDRTLTLRDLEAQYLRVPVQNPAHANHLTETVNAVAYTGACRAITNRMPESRVMVLGGLLAGALGSAATEPDGMIRIWQLTADGGVSALRIPPESVVPYEANGWRLSADAGLIASITEMRAAKLPRETGGVLYGLVDIIARSIHIVLASPAPEDSSEEIAGFMRGTGGVQEEMDRIGRQTAGQLRYIGEWHSHPPRVSTAPSATDLKQIDWLAGLMGRDEMPALMLIAGDHEVSLILAGQTATPLQTAGENPSTGQPGGDA